MRYTLNEDEVLTITNPDEVAGYYRYPDLTAQVNYLFQAAEQTINSEAVRLAGRQIQLGPRRILV